MSKISEFIDSIQTSVKKLSAEDRARIKEICTFLRNNYQLLPGIYWVVDYTRHNIPCLIAPSHVFFRQSDEAKAFLDGLFTFEDFLMKGEGLVEITKKKMIQYIKDNLPFVAIRISDVYCRKNNRRIVLSVYSKVQPMFNKFGEVFGALVHLDFVPHCGEDLFVLYSKETQTGERLNPDGIWVKENFNHLKDGDSLILQLLYNDYSEKEVAELFGLGLDALKRRLTSLRKIYHVRTTRALLSKLKMLELI